MYITCFYLEGLENLVSIRADLVDGWATVEDIEDLGGNGLADDAERAYRDTLSVIGRGGEVRELGEDDIREILSADSRGRKFKEF